MRADGSIEVAGSSGSDSGGAVDVLLGGTGEKKKGGVKLWVHPSSVLFNRRVEWVVFNEVVEMAGKVYVKDVTTIEKAWLLEYAPEFYRVREVVRR